MAIKLTRSLFLRRKVAKFLKFSDDRLKNRLKIALSPSRETFACVVMMYIGSTLNTDLIDYKIIYVHLLTFICYSL